MSDLADLVYDDYGGYWEAGLYYDPEGGVWSQDDINTFWNDITGYSPDRGLIYDFYGRVLNVEVNEASWRTFDKFTIVLTTLSLFACLITLVVFTLLRVYKPKLANRVSLRLAAIIALADIVYNSGWITVNWGSVGPSNTSTCAAAGFVTIFGGLLSVFLTFAIGLNIFLVFVLKIQVTSLYEKLYLAVASAIALALAITAVAADRFGFNGLECWFKPPGVQTEESYNRTLINENAWSLFYGWILVAVAGCAVFIIMFWIILKRNEKLIATDLKSTLESNTSNNARAQASKKRSKMINRTVARISWYCIVPILSQTVNMAYDLYSPQQYGKDWFCLFSTCTGLVMASVLLACSHGFFNAVIFLACDPTVAAGRTSYRKYLVRKYYLSHMIIPPNFAALQSASSVHKAGIDRLIDTVYSSQNNVSLASQAQTQGQVELKLSDLIVDSRPKNAFMFHLVRITLLKPTDINIWRKDSDSTTSLIRRFVTKPSAGMQSSSNMHTSFSSSKAEELRLL
ncbi:hypothetical protein BC832DRAFT_593936 [Gaertneriomyces semiglobifer]|nr:hypothetical protein BC832DRAFT_593936 [Gaertneriomyces semiglobifer]